MKAISRHSTSRRSPSASGARSRASNSISPPTMRALRAITPMMARASVVLPQPDSPTSPTTCPRATSSVPRSTAATVAPPERYSTLRSFSASMKVQQLCSGGGAARAVCSPPPCGEGLGVGVRQIANPAQQTRTPLPNPPPQGGREPTARAASFQSKQTRSILQLRKQYLLIAAADEEARDHHQHHADAGRHEPVVAAARQCLARIGVLQHVAPRHLVGRAEAEERDRRL